MVDLLGLSLLLVGLALIVAELTFPGYYVGVAGTVGTIVGLLQMVWPWFLTSSYGGPVAALIGVVAAILSFQFYRRFTSPIDRLGGSPGPDLVGKSGIVTQSVRPHTTKGRVEIEGKMWGADAAEPIGPGSHIIVETITETHLIVRRSDVPGSEPRI
ncbi:MAG TPA: NfeD family protein [Candidatus Thermoplasmatota archaeon]